MLTKEGLKACSACKAVYVADARSFPRAKSSKDGLGNQCKKCIRARYLRQRHEVCAKRCVYRQNNPTRTREAVIKWRLQLRAEMLEAYGDKCECCGEGVKEFLTIDHRMGGGQAHIRMKGGNYPLYHELRQLGWPKELFRLLCWNCNFATRRGEPCPHKRSR